MRYDISKAKAPEMPNLGKGTECIKLLLSQASKDMYEPLVPMFFPVLGAHISGAEFQYPDLTWKEMCGQMAHLVADSGNNKGQLGNLVEAICRDFRQHDEEEMKKLVEWSKRALVSAWKAGCILWALNGQTWTRSMGEMVEWLLYRDMNFLYNQKVCLDARKTAPTRLRVYSDQTLTLFRLNFEFAPTKLKSPFWGRFKVLSAVSY